MENLKYFDKFYIDREKDIVVELYKNSKIKDELTYITVSYTHLRAHETS